MKTLPEVEAAKTLMMEAIDWSVIKWLSEKKRVRRAADQANATLDAYEDKLRNSWSPEFKQSYKSGVGVPDIQRSAKRIKEAHGSALQLRREAEDIFDKAEKRLSTALARDGCRKAIEGWEMHLKALRLAEEAAGARAR